MEEICALMQNLVAQRATKPTITATWSEAARLLLDRERHSLEEISRVMRWAADDRFWRKNVLGLPKFREHYDKLRLGMEEAASSFGHRKADEAMAYSRGLQSRAQELEALGR